LFRIIVSIADEEFKKQYLGLRLDLQQENSVPFPKAQIPSVELPKEFDWRDHNAVTPVKNQVFLTLCQHFLIVH